MAKPRGRRGPIKIGDVETVIGEEDAEKKLPEDTGGDKGEGAEERVGGDIQEEEEPGEEEVDEEVTSRKPVRRKKTVPPAERGPAANGAGGAAERAPKTEGAGEKALTPENLGFTPEQGERLKAAFLEVLKTQMAKEVRTANPTMPDALVRSNAEYLASLNFEAAFQGHLKDIKAKQSRPAAEARPTTKEKTDD